MHSFYHTPVKLNIRILHIRTVHEVQFSGVAAVVKNLSFNLFVDAFIALKHPPAARNLNKWCPACVFVKLLSTLQAVSDAEMFQRWLATMFCAVFKTHWSGFLSALVLLPYQAVMQLVSAVCKIWQAIIGGSWLSLTFLINKGVIIPGKVLSDVNPQKPEAEGSFHGLCIDV